MAVTKNGDRKVVYIAGPISKGDLIQNITQAHNAAMVLMKAGLSPIVPHGSCFWGNVMRTGSDWVKGFAPEVLPSGTSHEDWYGMDLPIVKKCDILLRLPGKSNGADAEVEEALLCGTPVFFTVEEVIAWAKGQST